MSRTATRTVSTVAAAALATATPAPAPLVSLANANATEQAGAIIETMKAPHRKVAAAALAECNGNPSAAAALVGESVLPTLHKIGRIVPILRNSAPAPLFADGNNRGARVGELFASALGLSSLYRDASRASLKDARAALVEGARA